MQQKDCMINNLDLSVRSILVFFVRPEACARNWSACKSTRREGPQDMCRKMSKPYLPSERAQPCPSMSGMEEIVAPQLCC